MRSPVRLVVFLLVAAVLPLSAQDSSQGAGTQATGTQAAAASAGPGEPDIVMPQVILQVEDLSVEKVVAQLPPEGELLPPERPIPVLAEGDLNVGDPTLGQNGLVPDMTVVPAQGKLLSADILLGAGMQNGIIGTLSLKTLGADPRFSLSFNHETLDGYWTQKAGSGFSMRNDLLDGTLKFGLGPFDTSLAGSFSETENGLQGQPVVYGARLARAVSGSADFSATPLGWLTLGAGTDIGTDSVTLSAGTPRRSADFLVSPRVSAQARFGAVSLGLQSSYSYRTETNTGGSDLQRFSVGTTLSADLPGTFILNGDFAWSWNSQPLSRFPFSIGLTGTPWEFITLSLGGGYKVQQYNLRDLITSQSFSLPGTVADDRGWFGSGSVQLAFSRDLSASLALRFMASEALPVGSATQDPTTGLFPVTQTPGTQFSADGGLRWGISPAFSVSAGWHHEFGARPFFTHMDTFTAAIVGLEPSGAYGGNLSLSVSPAPGGLAQPLLGLSGFWKVSDVVKLKLDGNDLLLPLFGGTRTDIGPYEAPGFRVSGSVEISL